MVSEVLKFFELSATIWYVRTSLINHSSSWSLYGPFTAVVVYASAMHSLWGRAHYSTMQGSAMLCSCHRFDAQALKVDLIVGLKSAGMMKVTHDHQEVKDI